MLSAGSILRMRTARVATRRCGRLAAHATTGVPARSSNCRRAIVAMARQGAARSARAWRCRACSRRAAARQRARRERDRRMFRARGDDFAAVCRAADELRADVNGDTRQLCRDAQHQLHQHLLLRLPVLRLLEGQDRARICAAVHTISSWMRSRRRVREAWARGATEVCMQGGIHPVLHRRGPISRSAAR